MTPDQPPKSDWRRRWALVRITVLFCAVLVFWIVIWGPDDRVRETALLGLLSLSGAVILGYLGFATVDDRNWLQTLTTRRNSREQRDPNP